MENMNWNKIWASGFNIDYYKTYRSNFLETFPSELWAWFNLILHEKNSRKTSIKPIKLLDVGCAQGASFKILSKIFELIEWKLDYTGIDIDDEVLDKARKLYSKAKFEQCDISKGLPYRTNSFDVVMAYGIGFFPQYRKLVKDFYRVSRKYLLIDPRLTLMEGLDGKKASVEKVYATIPTRNGKHVKYPRIILNARSFTKYMLDLNPKPEVILVAGYYFPWISNNTYAAKLKYKRYSYEPAVSSWMVVKGKPHFKGKTMFHSRLFPTKLLSNRDMNSVKLLSDQVEYYPLP
jgi:hypothetical protein